MPKDTSNVALRTLSLFSGIGGLDLGGYFDSLTHSVLVCATEKRTDGEIDHFADAMRRVLAERRT